ncbi:MAG: tRNA pseudouridine(55) synthase TruB [Candidatus Uhrbacteria bacterium]
MQNVNPPTFLLIDKPVGPTSHDIVDKVRRATGERRVGHAGTLDPFASGLLIIGVGRESTRELGTFLGMDKEYEATFVLGASSDTDDLTGKITPMPFPIPIPPSPGGGSQGGGFEEKIKTAMKKFIGEIEQIPPAYSAIKIKGKKMYEAAREGKPLEAKARAVKIYGYDLIPFESDSSVPFVGARHLSPIASEAKGDGAPQRTDESNEFETLELRVRIRCSSGTYIRALARDLGRALGTGGYVSELRRTKIGEYKIEDAVPPPQKSVSPTL